MKVDGLKIRVSKQLVSQAISARETLEKTDIGVLDAARFVKEISELGRTKKLNQLRAIFRLGYDVFSQKRNTPDFRKAFDIFLRAKAHLRERSLLDYRQIRIAVFKHFPKLATQKIHTVSAIQCREILETAFHTVRQRRKAYAVLHAVFGYCRRHGWCRENPVSAIDPPLVREREIVPLSIEEIVDLFHAANKTGLPGCIPAIAIMLFAGIRPREIERLSWSDIDWEENVIAIAPTHSKTGGARHVTIVPCLRKILNRYVAPESVLAGTPICPPDWQRKWKRIRRAAGWRFPEKPWTQDVLRHTYASYHLKFFKNLPQLQCEMGHSSARLLRTRYLSMRNVTADSATLFWNSEF